MNQNDFFEVLGFLANPIRNSRVELEATTDVINKYRPAYRALTGNILPTPSPFVTELPNGANKRGKELRVYFNADGTIPVELDIRKTSNNRHGYDAWNFRLNNVEIIGKFFQHGFIIGGTQDEASVIALVPNRYLGDFNRGYAIP